MWGRGPALYKYNYHIIPAVHFAINKYIIYSGRMGAGRSGEHREQLWRTGNHFHPGGRVLHPILDQRNCRRLASRLLSYPRFGWNLLVGHG
jgi:hypothetical protein